MKHAEFETRGAVYALCGFNGMLVAGVNSKLQLLQAEMEQIRAEKEQMRAEKEALEQQVVEDNRILQSWAAASKEHESI